MIFNKFIHKEDFYLKDSKIFFTEDGKKKAKQAKKITGTRLASVLGKDEYTTPFQVWCDMFRFYKQDMEDFFTKAGSDIEPKLLDFASDKLNKKFTTYDNASIGYDAFKDQKIFGGIPDGEEMVDGKVKTILEIKTASLDKYQWTKKDNELVLVKKLGMPIITSAGSGLCKWFKKCRVIIPTNYRYQLGLYLYLRGIDTGYFCVSFLGVQDYLNSKNFDIDHISPHTDLQVLNSNLESSVSNPDLNKRVTLIEEFKIDLTEFKKIIDRATYWHKEHIETMVSPTLTNDDLEWLRFGYPDL